MYSLLGPWGLGLRTRPEYPAHRIFSSWEDVMVLLDSRVLAGPRRRPLPVGEGVSLGDSSCY